MGIYDVNVNGFDLKVRVVDRAEIISLGVSELREQINWSMPIVGINIYTHYANYDFPLLQLCAGNRCLLFVSSCVNPLPECLKYFMDDPDICFVGTKSSLCFNRLSTEFGISYEHKFARGVDVRELAAKILKKPDILRKSEMSEIAAEAGISLDVRGDFEVLKALSTKDCAFSNQQVKCLARYPHAAYLIGKKLLSSL